MKTIIEIKTQITKPVGYWCDDVRPEHGKNDRMYKVFNSNDQQGARGAPM